MPRWKRIVCGLLCGIAGPVVLAIMLPEMDAGFGMFAFAGAFTAGMINAPSFGGEGSVGLLRALWGAVCATFFGAALAGVYMGVLVMFAGGPVAIAAMPFLVFMALLLVGNGFAMPQVIAVWVVAMTVLRAGYGITAALHKTCTRYAAALRGFSGINGHRNNGALP
jgi:hypothetical protein